MSRIEPSGSKPIEPLKESSAEGVIQEEISLELPAISGEPSAQETIQSNLKELKNNPLPKVLGVVSDAIGEGREKLPPGTLVVAAALVAPDYEDLSEILRALFHRAAEGS